MNQTSRSEKTSFERSRDKCQKGKANARLPEVPLYARISAVNERINIFLKVTIPPVLTSPSPDTEIINPLKAYAKLPIGRFYDGCI